MALNHNPIGKVGIFNTPEDMETFQKYLSEYTGSEGIVAQVAAWMAWNLASKIIDEHLEKSNDKDL